MKHRFVQQVTLTVCLLFGTSVQIIRAGEESPKAALISQREQRLLSADQRAELAMRRAKLQLKQGQKKITRELTEARQLKRNASFEDEHYSV